MLRGALLSTRCCDEAHRTRNRKTAVRDLLDQLGTLAVLFGTGLLTGYSPARGVVTSNRSIGLSARDILEDSMVYRDLALPVRRKLAKASSKWWKRISVALNSFGSCLSLST